MIRFKEDYSCWRSQYESNQTMPLEDILSPFADVRLELIEPPSELRETAALREEFWQDFISRQPGFTNNPKYATRGKADLVVQDNTLLVKAFVTDYATVKFKNARSSSYDERLTTSQRDFFDNRMLFLGAGAYVTSLLHPSCYLMGYTVNKGDRGEMWEYVPQGLVDPRDAKNSSNVLEATVQRELGEETGLSLKDCLSIRATHLNLGPKYGDFTLIWNLHLKPEAEQKIRPNPKEHRALEWKEKVAADASPEHLFSLELTPVTAALFKVLTGEGKGREG